MQLREWLAREGMTLSEFASRIGVSQPTLSGICAGKQWMSRPVAQAIERETRGEVTANDFVHLSGQSAPEAA